MMRLFISILLLILSAGSVWACSMFYYVDKSNGKIYFVNNEDYWYDTDAYIQVIPAGKATHARLWYGWNNFAQGGINDSGLLFDGAVTPRQKIPQSFHEPDGRNVGDEMLARCASVEEALAYLDKERIAISEGHMLLGDKTGNAVVLEWVNGERKLIPVKDNMLIASNFLLSDTAAGNYPCYRYQSIEARLKQLSERNEPLNLKKIGNAIAGAVQVPQKDKTGRTAGTLYTTFINVSDMELTIVYKLDNAGARKIDLRKAFAGSRHKIKLNNPGD